MTNPKCSMSKKYRMYVCACAVLCYVELRLRTFSSIIPSVDKIHPPIPYNMQSNMQNKCKKDLAGKRRQRTVPIRSLPKLLNRPMQYAMKKAK